MMNIRIYIIYVLALHCARYVLSHNSCPKECRCSYTSTAQLTVFCKGESLSHVTSKLSADTVIYHYEAHEEEVNLGGTNFSHLTSLESLHLTSPFDNIVLSRKIKEILHPHQKVLWPLQKLKELRISVNWELGTALPDLLRESENLEILDLSNTRKLDYTNLKGTLAGLENSSSFRILNLQNTQTLEHLHNGFTLDLSELLEPLKNCPLEELDISYNALRTIRPGLISKAPRLKKLDASNNLIIPLLTSALSMEVLLHPSIIEVDVSEQGFSQSMKSSTNDTIGYDKRLLGNKKQKTVLPNRGRDMIDPDFYLRHKDCLDQIMNNLCSIFSKECETVVHICTVHHVVFCNLVAVYTPGSASIPCEYIPPIHSMLDPDCGGCFVFPSTGNLRILHIHNTNNYDEVLAFSIFKGKTCYNRNNSIEVFDFSHNRKHGYPDIDNTFSTSIVGWDKMKVLNISHNGIQRPAPDLGHNLPEIEVLDLSYNLLDLQGKDGDFLAGATSVVEVNLAGNLVHNIPYNRFSALARMETLNLSNNYLESFVVDIQNLKKLSFLDLSGNKITALSADMTDQLSSLAAERQHSSLKIDLSKNSLLCTCNVRHFTDWILSQPHNIEFVDFHDYMCWNDESKQVPFHRLGKPTAFTCLGKKAYIGIGVGSGSLVTILIVLLIIVIYRKRWWFQYLYFLARNLWNDKKRTEQESEEFKYDLFVAYNRHDKHWVDEILQPKLETRHGIKLCIHERDFELGGYIPDQVIECIEKSRKTLLILSPNFVRSTWCKFEYRMAHQKLFRTGHDILLLAILRPLDGVEICKTLKALLEQKTYVEWREDQDGQNMFWAKLISALNIPRRRAHVEENVGERNCATNDVEAECTQHVSDGATTSASASTRENQHRW